ncbi:MULTISPECIES: hypothetical protein [Shewanella]|nr:MULTISPECIES: hypothetical protein [Shewanella]QXN24866.1 hypothetical protein KVP08_020380 [Shewanella putrefaciens]ABI40843.1 conserved hypothetical protein [Shewanella sp. MR-4]MCL1120863.1 hypothetical protein [Shewanella seohaensis]MDH1472242.1 hypothetical protein [Shewanella sp. GD03713]UXM82673.1 hypothetical protein N7V09_03415 [Shewanella seohaensis]
MLKSSRSLFGIFMHHTLGRSLLVIFTLLALVGQSVASNGHAMVMRSMEMSAMVHNPSSQGMDHAAMMQMNTENRADSGAMASTDCCNDQMLPGAKQHCCDGTTSCLNDCGHCLTISVAGTLFSPHLWPSVGLSDTPVATPMPHFHSISLSSAFKPPIA